MSLLDTLERAYYRYRPYIPGRLLFHPQYFKVLALARRRDAGDDLLSERTERLRHVLTTCVKYVPQATRLRSARSLSSHLKSGPKRLAL